MTSSTTSVWLHRATCLTRESLSVRRVVSALTILSLSVNVVLAGMLAPASAHGVTLEQATEASRRLSAGGHHTVALTADGVVSAWGANGDEQCAVPDGLATVMAVACGSYHSLALQSDGTVAAWGLGASDGVIPGLSGVASLAAGSEHSLALKSDGTILAWGVNSSGQCGVPAGLGGVAGIAAGGYHSLALKSNGTVVAWGRNSERQCNVPTGLTGVVAIAGGLLHSLALKSDGTVVAWGRNSERQCNVPTGLTGVVAIAAGLRHSLALKSDGTVVAWGGRAADGSVDSSVGVPQGLGDVVAVSAGSFHSVAMRSDGTVVGWGDNQAGQCFGAASAEPRPGSRGVPTNAVFTVRFSATAQQGASFGQIALRDSKGNTVASNRSLSGDALTVVPTAGLKTDTGYTLTLPPGSVKDARGNGNPAYNFTYETLDTRSPTVSMIMPANGATGVPLDSRILVTFSEDVEAGVSFGGIALRDDAGSPVDCATTILFGNRISVRPREALKLRATYTLTVPGGAVTDLSGNPLVAPYVSTLTTGVHAYRVAGTDRILTAIDVSRDAFATASTVIVATAYDFPDALAAAPLARALQAPILLVKPVGRVTSEVIAEIRRLGATKAIVVGGTGAVSDVTEASLRDAGLTVRRVAGSSRYDTASKIAFELKTARGVSGFDKAYVATGENFPDALAAGGVAAAEGVPILLTRKDVLPSQTQAAITALAIDRSVVLGGTGAVSAFVESQLPKPTRLAGKDRYATAVEVSRYAVDSAGFSSSSIYLATGLNYPDALAAGAASASTQTPIILVSSRLPLPAPAVDFMVSRSSQLSTIKVLGGSAAVPDLIVDAVRSALK